MARAAGPGSVPWGGLERRMRSEWLAVVPALMLLTFLVSYFGAHAGLGRLDHLFYDRTLGAAGHTAVRDDIVIVALDDGSIDELGYWPWPRSVHARLLDRLRDAKAVGMDIVFNDPNPAYPDDDRVLARALAEQGRVVLPLVVSESGSGAPLPMLASAAAGTGYINAHLDADGVVRSIVPRRVDAQGRSLDHFITALLDAGGDGAQASALRRQGSKPRLIYYAGKPGSFAMYPYARVLKGDVPTAAFAGKYVLVGAWASALGDVLSAPLSRAGEPMAGVEILANGLQNALDDSWISAPGRWQTAALSMLPVLLVCVALRRLSPRQSFFASGAALVAVFVADWLLMRYGHMWVPPAASLVGVVLAYPVWSWRSQEAALRHIDYELQKLQDEKLLQARPLPDAAGGLPESSLPARVVKLHNAIALLRQSIGQREETLRFLSHDMRSPQNAILALTQLQRYGQTPLPQKSLLDRVDQCARKTLALVDGFVQLARAESMTMHYREIDLVDLLHAVCDERWPVAQRRKIAVAFDSQAVQARVMAEEGMLARAFGNLLDNAINYSPDGSHVLCRLTRQGAHWVAAVQDKGRGISAEQQAQLFVPFRRLHDGAPGNPVGSGLGLAFVHAVVLRHGGAIAVQSTEGRGSTFSVTLPAYDSPA